MSGRDVAIIGLAGRFPGARNIQEFWDNLRSGVESISIFSDQELRDSGVPQELIRNPNYVKSSPILESFDQFDASFFGYSPKEARLMDPQHRLFLETSWTALEHAGYAPESYAGMIGVFAGSAGNMNSYLISESHVRDALRGPSGSLQHMSTDKDYLTTKVSYKLNLRGPSVNVQTACSTSLVALHLACQSVLGAECDIALAGGVSVRFPHKAGYLHQEGGMFSRDGHCRPFDSEAGGTLFGSGVGVVVLKQLEDAIESGDTIYAVIKASAINNDGSSKMSFAASSADGISKVATEAIALSGVDAQSISYVEAHSTATVLGDPVEVAALTRAFRAFTRKTQFCSLGSVKGNVGHLEAAAGMAGLIKTILALNHKELPPSINVRELNPKIAWERSPFEFNRELRPWISETPRRAGLSSTGIGGTNAHVVLEEGPVRAPRSIVVLPRSRRIYRMSARSETALNELATNVAAHLAQEPQESFADVCLTANAGRVQHEHRLAIVSTSLEDISKKLHAFAHGDRSGCVDGKIVEDDQGIVFVFGGQTLDAANVGRELVESEPVFRAALERCDRALRPILDGSLLALLYPEEPKSPAALLGRLTPIPRFSRSNTHAQSFGGRGASSPRPSSGMAWANTSRRASQAFSRSKMRSNWSPSARV